jgi:selenophosphate synthase
VTIIATLAFSSIGSQIFLSAGVPATIDAAGFGALSYTEVKEVTDIGMIGPESAVITHQPVSENTTYKLKAGRNNGSLDLKGARAPTDPGQALLIAAENSTAPYAIKVKLQNGTFLYSQVLIMSYKTHIGNQGQITGFESKAEISGAIVTV